MKVCVTARDGHLDAHMDQRFGRCQYFIIIDSETMSFEVINNHESESVGGAGIQAGQLMADKNVSVVITGNVGPNAFKTLQAAGIQVITGVTGIIRYVIDRFNKGELTAPVKNPTVDSHFGMQ